MFFVYRVEVRFILPKDRPGATTVHYPEDGETVSTGSPARGER